MPKDMLHDDDWMRELSQSADHAEQLVNRIELCVRAALTTRSFSKLDDALEGLKILRQVFGIKEIS